MDKSGIDRINELARKAKTIGLTEEEKLEQQTLRQQYIAEFRQSLKATLDNVVIVEPDGSKRFLKNKASENSTGKDLN